MYWLHWLPIALWHSTTLEQVFYLSPARFNISTAAKDPWRAATPIRKVIMTMRGNAVSWSPMEAFNLSVANEDHNVYTFDMRKLDTALNVHKDHVGTPALLRMIMLLGIKRFGWLVGWLVGFT